MNRAEIERVAGVFIAARREGRAVKELPVLSLDDAYAVQREFVRQSGATVIGYKIGCATKESQALVGASSPFFAPMFAQRRFESPARLVAGDFFTIGVEAEFAFTLGADLPARAKPYTHDEVAAASAMVRPVIEICDTRIADWKKASAEQIIADNGFHGGLVAGRGVAEWRAADLGAHRVEMSIDGTVRGQGSCAAALGDPMEVMTWTANELSRRGYGLRAGDIVSTGTWTGLHFIKPGAVVVAEFGSMGRIELSLSA